MAALAAVHSKQVVHCDLREEVIRRSSQGGGWRMTNWSEARTGAHKETCDAEMQGFRYWLDKLVIEEEEAQDIQRQPEEPDTGPLAATASMSL